MLIFEKNPKSIAAESYRTLRTNLQYSSFDKTHKVIVVTSSGPSEGKSTTAANLALALAHEDKKVMLVDCDLRKPSLHKKFKISNINGLSDLIIGNVELKEACHKYDKNITILSSGKIPPNPAEMLASKSMESLIEALKKVFDYIILDTPPVQAVADAQILSTKADGTILVIRAEHTKRDEVHSAIDLLKKVNANIIGTVLNGVESTKGHYYYYYGENNESN